MLIDPCQGNPYKVYEGQAKNLELYTKEQLRNKKRRKQNEKSKSAAAKPQPSADQIQQIIRKDKVIEIFKDLMVSKEESLFNDQNIANFVAHKFKRKMAQIRYGQLNLYINLKLIGGPRYIEALLARIRMVKELFLMDVERGMEVLIPYEISQAQLPPSFRYYDFILMFVQERVTEDRRHFQKMKMKLSKVFDSKLSLSETLGVGKLLGQFEDKKKGKRMTSGGD